MKATQITYFRYVILLTYKQFTRITYPDFIQEIDKGFPSSLFKEIAKYIGRHIGNFGNLVQR